MPAKADYEKDPEKYRKQAREWYARNAARAKERNSEYAKKNSGRVLEAGKRWRKENPRKASEYAVAHRRKKNGFPRELFAQRMAEQGGLCGICREPMQSGLGGLSACADHCHATSAPRGVLCKRCNLMLGLARDGCDILAAAVAYLEKWKRTA